MYSIKHLFHIAAPADKVYEAIASINGLQNWWTADTSGDDKLNGIIAFRFNGHGPNFKVTALKPGELVTWECIDEEAGWSGHTFTFALGQNDGKTRIRFSHDGWQAQDDFYSGCSFSWGRYMESLRQYCQTGIGEAFGSATYRK
jgi:uncharacterized protein YndB with AHSA1/START domain